jgi:hypothetical protein
VPGFVVRLRSGSARFAYQYKHRGRTRRVNIGAYGPLTLDQARDLARSLYAQVRGGNDPVETRRTERAKRAKSTSLQRRPDSSVRRTFCMWPVTSDLRIPVRASSWMASRAEGLREPSTCTRSEDDPDDPEVFDL